MIVYSKAELNRANAKVVALLLKIIETKRGGKFNQPLRKVTGNLRRNIKSVIYESGGKLFIDLEVMEYYKYLDEGTKRITNPWFLTEELTTHDEFSVIVGDLIKEGITEATYNVLSSIKP